ncbi:molecular chaperone DnaJ [Novosphingobium sp. SL115]|uniref:molecular chaperone DnaJ n=1 Tax=Novosphingobium sp. SL115 TaxID=2995150 RepID=UPI002274A1FC|nr:molecular chaperone DnaJ [Novosphingobium sp. SL115]MCY1670571.1 molecular chaperone DnaJ [Novosphingobium sp. SL115]
MAKLLTLILIASLACKLLAGKWPWELLKADGRSANEAKARALLGISRTAGYDEVIEAHRRLIARVHPDRGGSSEAVHEANAARDLLLARLSDRRPG